MVKLDAIEIGQSLVPVVRIPLHDPDLFIDALLMPERTGARVVHHLAQVIIVVLQGLLAHNDIPATGKGPQHEFLGPRFTQFEFDSVRVADVDRFHRRKQGCAWTAKTLGRENDALICRLDVLGGKISTIVKFHAFTQEKRVGFAVLGNLPTVSQVRNDSLTTIPGVTPDQVVIHGTLGAHIGDGA